MKLSSETLEILSGISKINSGAQINGAVFKKGSDIKVRRYHSDSPVMYATIKEEFPSDFAIHDIPKFLSAYKILGDPDITFGDKALTMKNGKERAKIQYIQPHFIDRDIDNFYSKRIKLPDVGFSFRIEKDQFKKMLDASNMFSTSQLSFYSNNGEVVVKTYNENDPDSDGFELSIGECDDWQFNIIVDTSVLQFLRRDYEVSISKLGLIEWKSEDVTYYVTCKVKSKK